MGPSQQASLLRVLEDKKYLPIGETSERQCRARFVFATNTDLRRRVAGQLREDLYYRINVATLTMPPLRSGAAIFGARAVLQSQAERQMAAGRSKSPRK